MKRKNRLQVLTLSLGNTMSASRLDLDDSSFKLEYIFYAIVGLVLVSVAGGALAAWLMDKPARDEFIRDHPLPKKKARKNE